MRLRRSHAIRYRYVPENQSSETEFSIQSDFLQEIFPAEDFYDRHRKVYFTGSHCTALSNRPACKRAMRRIRSTSHLQRFITPPSFPPSVHSQNSSLDSFASSSQWMAANAPIVNTNPPQGLIQDEDHLTTIQASIRQQREYFTSFQAHQQNQNIEGDSDDNNEETRSIQTEFSTTSSFQYLSRNSSRVEDCRTSIIHDGIQGLSQNIQTANFSNSDEEDPLLTEEESIAVSDSLNLSQWLGNVWESTSGPRFSFQGERLPHQYQSFHHVVETFIEVSSTMNSESTACSPTQFELFVPGSVEIENKTVANLNYTHRKYFKNKKDNKHRLKWRSTWVQKMKHFFGLQ